LDDPEIESAIALVPPLLRALEALGFVSRHLHAPNFPRLMPLVEQAEQGLRAVSQPVAGASPFRTLLDEAANDTLGALDALKSAFEGGDMVQVYRALRYVPRVQERLYQLVELPPVSRYFLDPATRNDEALAARLAGAPQAENTGVHHFSNEPGTRGGFSLYVPEYHTPQTPMPLVIALHGGSGHGRAFLWTWLRDARSHGAIVISPTARGNTWALQGEDIDTPNLLRMVEHVCGDYAVDRSHVLLTGMSDGGTFSYVTGLETDRPFTHLAPISAAFHPMLVSFAEPERLRGLPIRITHGALDWMFPIAMAREAEHFLSRAGANVTFVGLEDLSHTYPREQNPEIIRWLLAT
jgi:phospholipase/carboxylesterase